MTIHRDMSRRYECCHWKDDGKKIKKDFPGLVEYIELETIFEWSIECVSADVYIE